MVVWTFLVVLCGYKPYMVVDFTLRVTTNLFRSGLQHSRGLGLSLELGFFWIAVTNYLVGILWKSAWWTSRLFGIMVDLLTRDTILLGWIIFGDWIWALPIATILSIAWNCWIFLHEPCYSLCFGKYLLCWWNCLSANLWGSSMVSVDLCIILVWWLTVISGGCEHHFKSIFLTLRFLGWYFSLDNASIFPGITQWLESSTNYKYKLQISYNATKFTSAHKFKWMDGFEWNESFWMEWKWIPIQWVMF